jgi:rhomboid protease GluP
MAVQHVSDETEFDPSEQGQEPVPFPIPIYTYTLLVCIAAVYIAQFVTSADPEFFNMDRYSAFYAGFDKKAFLEAHEYWRILTGATVHSGILHVVLNSYALFSFGRLIEMLSNRAHLAIIFILSALGGGVLSLVFNPDVTSVGASGGIIGFLSYLAVYAFKRRQFISPQFRRSLLFNIGFILLYGLLMFNTIDNFGHIGGLIVGAIYGLIQIPSDEYVDPRQASRVTKIVGFACICIYGVTCGLTILLLANSR